MYIVCSDLESVLIPEVWVTIAEVLGIQELQLTTRDISNYKALMKQRLQILSSHRITLIDIQKIIKCIKPLDGALTFLKWLRKYFPTIILTDSFYEFVVPLMETLAYPTVFGNSLETDERGYIKNFKLRGQNGKIETIKAFKSLKFQTIVIGDSYNDIDMLREANVGILFKPSKNIFNEFPDLPAVNSYDELKKRLIQYMAL